MANAANSPFVKHPALLALFAPRPPPPFKPPMPTRNMAKLTGIAQFTTEFLKDEELPPPQKLETPTEKRERIQKEKIQSHLDLLAEREKQWDPHNNPSATKDPYKTLFVARLSYELNEDDLRREFERYGRIRDVKLIIDKETQKSRGYAFIEFERSNDLKEAFQHADGMKLKGRRILVDVERGRTVKTWKPRKLGGGLGKTRAAPNANEKNKISTSAPNSSSRHSSRSRTKSSRDHGSRRDNKDKDKYNNRNRDKYRGDRDYRDRDRRSGRGDRDRKDRDRDRTRDSGRRRGGGSRSRSRDRKDRSKRRDKDGDRKDMKDRDSRDHRGDRRGGHRDRGDRMDRGGGDDRGRKDRSRRRRSRSKEKTRSRR